MTDTTSAAPSDAEFEAFRDAFDWDGWTCPKAAQRAFARAVLARWGAPRPVAGEPDAYLHDDGYWTAAKTDAGRNLNDRLLFAGSPKVAVYTTPQPTQAQAGAVPLTDEQIRAMCKQSWVFDTAKQWVRITERAHGIGTEKGDSHGLPT